MAGLQETLFDRFNKTLRYWNSAAKYDSYPDNTTDITVSRTAGEENILAFTVPTNAGIKTFTRAFLTALKSYDAHKLAERDYKFYKDDGYSKKDVQWMFEDDLNDLKSASRDWIQDNPQLKGFKLESPYKTRKETR